MPTLVDQRFVDALAPAAARLGEVEGEPIRAQGQDALEALHADLFRYRSLLLAVAQVIWTRDAAGQMTGEQPSWCAFTGQTSAECQASGWLDAVHPDDRAATLARWEHSVSASVPCELEHRLRRHDGEYGTFSVRAVPIRGDDGTIREWVGMHTDVCARKRDESPPHDGQRQFRELADSMPQIVWAADPNGRFDYYNQRWYQFTGRPVGIGGDASWTDVVHPDDQEECLARWHAATQSGDAYEIEYRLREKTGAYHWFLRRALPVRDAAGKITRWFGTCTNIDTVKHSAEVLRDANVETVAANAELEAFSYSVAHDLRAPLRSIDGFSLALLEDNADQLDEQGKSHLARVRTAAQRMARLIDDLLSLSRVSRAELHKERVNLSLMARGIGERLQEADPERVGEFVVQSGLVVEADASLLSAVMENLLGNAWKFTSQRANARIEVGLGSSQGLAAYFVRDNGAGFDMAHVGKLFGAFQRLHASTEFPGTGIGLATVQRIVRRHGGRAWAEGEVAHGATFYFTLVGGSRS